LYYGMPEKDVEKLKTLETDVLGIFASKDKWINAEVVAAFEANMKAAGKKVKTKTFEAAHAFANPSREIYDKEAAEEANRMTVGFLKKGFE
ncbi:MAG: dienelactone hydrolase family protein, partial [Bacteroidota bacterium]